MSYFFFSFSFFLVAYFSNPYLVAGLFIVQTGYMWGRAQVIENYILSNYIRDKNYKATVLSIKNQVCVFFQFLVPFLIGYVMSYSYKIGYLVLGVCLFFILFVSFLFIKKDY